MATQVLPPKSVLVPFPAKQPAITQTELELLLALRAQAEKVALQVAEAEQSVRARLEAGSVVVAGFFKALLKVIERRNVSWKSVVVRVKGQQYADRVLAATKPDVYTTLVISA